MLRGKLCTRLIALLLPLAWPEAATAQSAGGAEAAKATGAQGVVSPPPAPRGATPAPRVVEAVAALADWVKGRGGTLSARVVEADTGRVWAEHTPALALNPASNMKVLTAAVALDRLGPEYRLSTGLYGVLNAGRVETLVLRGEGDPALGVEDLWQLARALPHLGVTQVGRVLVDQSRFDEHFVPPAFEQQPNEWASFRAPVSAVALERNAVGVHVLPTRAGEPARVWLEPAGVADVEGSVETRRPGSGEAIQLSMEVREGNLIARVGGHVAEGLPRMRFERRLDDPRRAPGLALAAMLGELKIAVSGAVALGGAEIKPRLAFHESPPLGVLVRELGKNSDNFYAEMLLEMLGADAGAVPASSQSGARVVSSWLGEHQLASPDTRISNGSGLFDANRVSAATLTGTLALAYHTPAVYPELLAQLALHGFNLSQETGRLAVQPQDMHFAVDTLRHSHDGFIHGAAGKREFLLEPAEKFQ